MATGKSLVDSSGPGWLASPILHALKSKNVMHHRAKTLHRLRPPWKRRFVPTDLRECTRDAMFECCGVASGVTMETLSQSTPIEE